VSAENRFGAIVLAAGLSSRMGGPNKLLQGYRGLPLLEHALKAVESLGVADCVAVTGRDCETISALAASYAVRTVHNPNYADGLGSSIAAGICALDRSIAGVFIALGDMPGVVPKDYQLLSRAFKTGAIMVPVFDLRRGHPVLFCTSYIPELSVLSGDEGARSLLGRHANAVIEVGTGNAGILRDLDLPEDFEEAVQH
jgi:molybdenum cofactor cytidylyltransferase